MSEDINCEKIITISRFKEKRLTFLKADLVNAIDNKISINIDVNFKEPEEILKGVYIAEILSRRGYICDVKFQSESMSWYCRPS